jgi:hypothetical protein
MEKFEAFCKKYGFALDSNKIHIDRIFNNNNLKTLHVDMYTEEPYMLLLRVEKNNVKSVIENGRLVFRDKRITVADILYDRIENCIMKQYNDSKYEFIFTVNNVCYKMFVVI